MRDEDISTWPLDCHRSVRGAGHREIDLLRLAGRTQGAAVHQAAERRHPDPTGRPRAVARRARGRLVSESGSSYDVRIFKVEARKGTRGTTYRLRWIVGGKRFGNSFATARLADSFRSVLMQASSKGEAFDLATGRPMSEITAARADRLWVQLAREFIDERWDEFAARHRQGTVDGLVTVTCGLLREGRQPPDLRVLREALMHWEFTTAARRRSAEQSAEYREALRWIAANSLPLDVIAQPDGIRAGMKAISTTL